MVAVVVVMDKFHRYVLCRGGGCVVCHIIICYLMSNHDINAGDSEVYYCFRTLDYVTRSP
jgi:hypothetical protein